MSGAEGGAHGVLGALVTSGLVVWQRGGRAGPPWVFNFIHLNMYFSNPYSARCDNMDTFGGFPNIIVDGFLYIELEKCFHWTG